MDFTEKFERLRRMSRAEISHRLRERLLIGWERTRVTLHTPVRSCQRPADLFGSGSGKEPTFYFDYSASGRARLAGLLRLQFPEWRSRAIREAEKIVQNELPLPCHEDLRLGRPIDWNRDPVTGRSWGLRFWADYDAVQHPFAGDPKLIFELNRHRHLPKLGRAFFLTGEERFAREALTHMLGWIDQCPRSRGINWHSSLDIAFRVINWIWTLFLISDSKALSGHVSRKIARSLYQQIAHVYTYPSLYSSPNTHLIGEAACLFIAGLALRGWNDAPHWLELGSALLTQELDRQVSAEGVHAELSSYYHCYTLDLYLQALVLARRNGVDFPGHAWTKLSLMIEFLLHLSRPDGSLPLLGDDDGGRALGLAGNDYHSYREALCTGAVLFGREDFKHQAGGFHEETLWLLGPESWDIYRTLDSCPPSGRRASYPEAGYFIQRSGWKPTDNHIVFDCGRYGMDSGGHSHADALSFDLSVQGHPVLIDPGTYVYSAAPAWRDYFRSTKAHNTAVVDDCDQSIPGGPFKWIRKAVPCVNRHFSNDELDYVECEHDGYLTPVGIVHRRRLLHLPSCGWALLDDFRGSGSHTIDLFYHFAPGIGLSWAAPDTAAANLQLSARVADISLCLMVSATASMDAEILFGCQDPIQGWASPRYGRKEPAPALRLRCQSSLPAAFLSLLLPAQSGAVKPARLLRVPVEGTLACELNSEEWRDLIVVSTGRSGFAVGHYEMNGAFFWVRESGGQIRRLFAVDGRRFAVGGSTIFNDRQAAGQIWARFDKNRVELEHGASREKFYVRNLRHREPELRGSGGSARCDPHDERSVASRPR